MAKKISYAVRDFAGLRDELVRMTREYYPNLISNFNDASIYSVLLDMNAAIADNLHFHIDRVWQETTLDFAQQRQSLFHIAKTYGVKIPGNRPSVALCDFSITVPVDGDKDDERYEGILRSGTQVSGGGQIFEVVEDIDFSNPFNSRGESNRLKIPNFDANNKLISYTITKREAVINGVTRIFRKVITETDQKPFFKLFLPERNVLGVTSIIHKDGTNYGSNPSSDEFLSSSNKWFEVKSLAENRVFIDDPISTSDVYGMRSGSYQEVTKKYVTEYTPEGYFSLIFGSGNVNPMTNLDNYINGSMRVNLSTYLNNTSLGEMVKPNTTLFIKYRVGGGSGTNLGVNVINTLESYDMVVNGPSQAKNNEVYQSLRVNNVTPAIGGSDAPTIEEIRNMVGYNFAAQERAVTLNDYKSIIETMPSTYGAPAKVNVSEIDNKIRVNLLSYDDRGALVETVSNTLRGNVMNYLSKYRMINDYIEIENGEVIDLGVEIDVMVGTNQNVSEIVRNIIETTSSFFNITRRKMGDPLVVGDLKREVGNIYGVTNVPDIRVFNKIGGNYSTTETSQSYVDDTTKEIQQIDGIIFTESNQIFQVRFPNSDIRVRVKTLTSATF